MAETLKRLCSGEPLGGTGLLLADRLDRVERESRLANDSMDDCRELKERQLANSSIWGEQQTHPETSYYCSINRSRAEHV